MYTDGYTLATYFIKLQYVSKVTSCSCNGAWLVIIRSVWKHPGAHQYPVLVQEVFQQLLWPLGDMHNSRLLKAVTSSFQYV